MIQHQLTLDLLVKDYATFTNFVVGKNGHLVELLRNLSKRKESFIYIYGPRATGKSHLLYALCQEFATGDLVPIYLTLRDKASYSVTILSNLEQCDLICLDDLEEVSGDITWEEQLLHCFNQAVASGKKMVISGAVAPRQLALHLPDLQSRLVGGGLVFQLEQLDDGAKIEAMQLRANFRGMVLEKGVAAYLVSRTRRDIRSLFSLLDRLERLTLEQQHRLTIPFVRKILSQQLDLLQG